MSNPLYYIVGLLLAYGYPVGVEPLRFARESTGLAAAAAILVSFSLVAWGVHRRLAEERARFLGLARLALRGLALTLYAVLIYVFHFPLWVWSLGWEDSALVGPIITLLPLLGLFGVLALLGARYDPRLADERGSFGRAVLFAFRGFLGFSLVPILLMLLIDVAVERSDALRRVAYLYPAVGWAVALSGMVVLMTVLPLLLRFALGARTLPAGAFRDRLEQRCRSSGFRCRDLLVVPTGGLRMANAFIVGIAAPLRYVFFTDAILTGMPPESLESVLAHEIAHSRRHHIPTFLAAMLGFAFLNTAALELLEGARVPAVLIGLGLLAWTLLFWIGLFGWVSRRFESEADLAAARSAPLQGANPYGAAAAMAEALQRVADLNRIPPWAWSWRHFSIERRIDILLEARSNPGFGESFERRCVRWRGAAVALLIGGLLAAGLVAVRQQGQVEERRSVYEAYVRLERGADLKSRGRLEEALEELRAGIAAGADEGRAWVAVADCERALGREGEARRAEEIARKKGLADPRLRRRLE
jgi:Zn-dependent protease with chaperone function